MYDTNNTKFPNANPCQISFKTRTHSGYVNKANHHCHRVLLTRIHDVTGSGEEDIILATVMKLFYKSEVSLRVGVAVHQLGEEVFDNKSVRATIVGRLINSRVADAPPSRNCRLHTLLATAVVKGFATVVRGAAIESSVVGEPTNWTRPCRSTPKRAWQRLGSADRSLRHQ